MAGCGQARNFCMKKSVNNFKIVAWVVAIFSASLVIFWLNMPRFLRDTIEYRLKVYNAELKSITIDKINPWTMCLSGFNALFYDGNVSFKKLDVRYEPLDLSQRLVDFGVDQTMNRALGSVNLMKLPCA